MFGSHDPGLVWILRYSGFVWIFKYPGFVIVNGQNYLDLMIQDLLLPMGRIIRILWSRICYCQWAELFGSYDPGFVIANGHNYLNLMIHDLLLPMGRIVQILYSHIRYRIVILLQGRSTSLSLMLTVYILTISGLYAAS